MPTPLATTAAGRSAAPSIAWRTRIITRLRADAQRAQAQARDPGGQRGATLRPARPDHTPATGSSGKPLPGLLTTLRPRAATRRLPLPRAPRHSSIAATPPIPTGRPRLLIHLAVVKTRKQPPDCMGFRPVYGQGNGRPDPGILRLVPDRANVACSSVAGSTLLPIAVRSGEFIGRGPGSAQRAPSERSRCCAARRTARSA